MSNICLTVSAEARILMRVKIVAFCKLLAASGSVGQKTVAIFDWISSLEFRGEQ